MYRTTLQRNLFTIYFSAGLDPLRNWSVHCRDGYIKRIYDAPTGTLVMEMRSLSLSLHYISCPRNPKQTLGIRLPILNLLIRNTNKYFSFEIKIMDDTKMHRRFRCANFLRCSSVQLFETTIPLTLCGNDWVLIYFNLAEFTRRCYNTSYIETDRVQINGNIHLRRIFFSETVIEYNKLPKDYQITLLDQKKSAKLDVTKSKTPPPTPIPSIYKGKYPTRKLSDKSEELKRTSEENIMNLASQELRKSMVRTPRTPTEKSFDINTVEVSEPNVTDKDSPQTQELTQGDTVPIEQSPERTETLQS